MQPCFAQEVVSTAEKGTASRFPVPVRVEQREGRWAMIRHGEPYFIKGVGGDQHLALAKALGANSLRTWGVSQDMTPLLDQAHALNMTVTLGLWLGHVRHGFDYGDTNRVNEQLERYREVVRRYRDHPALLCWGVGNEMEADGQDDRIWIAVNDLARMIKQEDPHHPTLTAIAEMKDPKIRKFIELCPDVDVLGINTYGGLSSLPRRLQLAGYQGPYIVTEFGPLGTWEVRKTAWGAPIEQTSHAKGQIYLRNYRASIVDQPQCLGSYVFKWGHKQEATSTWFSMFLPTGEKLAGVDAMAMAWSNRAVEHPCPAILAMQLGQSGDSLAPAISLTTTLTMGDESSAPLSFDWELREESKDRKKGGDAEREPVLLWSRATDLPELTWTTPKEIGQYRLYVIAKNQHQSAATANIPFEIRN